jgi:lipoprotein-anchoring transpeptidase ErfK/SrfK
MKSQPTMPNPALHGERPQRPPLPAPRPAQPQRGVYRRGVTGRMAAIKMPPNANPGQQAQPQAARQPMPVMRPNTVMMPNPNMRQPVPQSGYLPMPPNQRAPLPAQPRRNAHPKGKLSPALRVGLLLTAGFVLFMMVIMGGVFAIGIGGAYNSGVLPGVSAGGVTVAGLSETDAAGKLANTWETILLRDGERSWRINTSEAGIALDANATAAEAYAQGRGEGSALQALFGNVDVAPVVAVDEAALRALLTNRSEELSMAPRNAGVALVNGKVQATPPENGRAINIDQTIVNLMENPGEALADGVLELAMSSVAPAVQDASPMVAEAERLLQNALDISIYDPVTGDMAYWSVPPETWGNWLTAVPNPDSPIGLALNANPDDVRAYLSNQAAVTFDASRAVDVEAGVASITQALAAGKPGEAYLIVKHQPRTYTVQSGETITSIAWDFGIPYLYIMEANGGIESVSVGQEIVLPPADQFLLKPVVPNKRVIVSISQQHVWVYENGALKWDWVASTGINSSPTWPGVYQVISHEPNAYAGNWNLWMPNFMGVYMPIPGAEFTNGFHGFPTRGGGQLLWENSLGTKVTYGCILLNNTNAQLLYDWAEEGVVVVIEA